jgi:hypothetical protein
MDFLLTMLQSRRRESDIAPFLTEFQARVKSEDIRVGSYPKWEDGVYVSLIGNKEQVLALAEEVARGVDGQVVKAGTPGDDGTVKL